MDLCQDNPTLPSLFETSAKANKRSSCNFRKENYTFPEADIISKLPRTRHAEDVQAKSTLYKNNVLRSLQVATSDNFNFNFMLPAITTISPLDGSTFRTVAFLFREGTFTISPIVGGPRSFSAMDKGENNETTRIGVDL